MNESDYENAILEIFSGLGYYAPNVERDLTSPFFEDRRNKFRNSIRICRHQR